MIPVIVNVQGVPQLIADDDFELQTNNTYSIFRTLFETKIKNV